jgi:predicted ferric reductase
MSASSTAAAPGISTLKRVMATAEGDLGTLSVFLCGPAGLVRNFQTTFRHAGVAGRHIYREHFDLR